MSSEAASAAFAWLVANAHRFGIVLSYPADQVHETGYAFEPWHWRYVGVEAADAIAACGIAPSTWLRMRNGHPPRPPVDPRIEALLEHAEAAIDGLECDATTVTVDLRNMGTRRWNDVRAVAVGGADPGLVAPPVPCLGGGQRGVLTLPRAADGWPTHWQLVDSDNRWLPGGSIDSLCVPH